MIFIKKKRRKKTDEKEEKANLANVFHFNFLCFSRFVVKTVVNCFDYLKPYLIRCPLTTFEHEDSSNKLYNEQNGV